MTRIFISYRRDDTATISGRIYDRLKKAFGGSKNIFKDVDSIPYGVDFRIYIDDQVRRADVQLVIIGHKWLNITAPDGKRRLESPDDFVRLEIESALKHNILIVPVLVEEASMPTQADLPPSLELLPFLNAAEIRNDPDFHRDMNRLISSVKRTLKSGGIQLERSPTAEPRHWYRLAGAISAMLIVAVLTVLTLSNPLGGGNADNKLNQTEVAQTVAAGHDVTQTSFGLALTASSTPGLTATPTVFSQPATALTSSPIPAYSPNSIWKPTVQKLGDIPFVEVPAGCFMMGSNVGGDDEKPRHEVCLKTYWIGQTEVTNAQYKRCVDAGSCTPPGDRAYYDDPVYSNHPVINIDWNQATIYAKWVGGSLPTEAQWEYAARGPESRVFPWGNEFDGTRLNFCDFNCEYDWLDTIFNDNYARTAPVGSYPTGASWVGAMDMAGNVWEWVADWYDKSFYASLPEGANDPMGPAAGPEERRIVRGGSWSSFQSIIRCAYRYGVDLENRYYGFGFRVVIASLTSN